MTDKYIRGDLLRLGFLLTVIGALLAGLKVYDTNTGVIQEIGAKFFNEIISKQ